MVKRSPLANVRASVKGLLPESMHQPLSRGLDSVTHWTTPRRIYWTWRTRPTREAALRLNVSRHEDPRTPLEALAIENQDLPWTKWWHYFDFYEERLGDLAAKSRSESLDEPLRILEIGVWRGGSLRLWREYFGQSAIIFGIDTDRRCLEIQNSGGVVCIGSQDDPEFLQDVVRQMGGVDVVIDDGSHISQHVIASFLTLFPLMNEGGRYFIEDLSTSYWPNFGGGLKRPDSSIEFLKGLVDGLNTAYFDPKRLELADQLDVASVGSVEFRDALALVTKNRRSQPALFYGGPRG